MAKDGASRKELAARRRRLLDVLVVAPGDPANLAERDTAWTGGGDFEHLSVK